MPEPLIPENNDPHNREIFAFKTPEFVPHFKGARWFLVAGVIILTLTAYAILTDSATMAIVFILLGGVYYLTHNQTPRIIDIVFTELGVKVDQRFYPYNTINAFWIVYKPPFVRRLYLRLGSKAKTELKIELNDQNPVQIRQLLAREIPEVEGAEESMTDILIRLLRLH